MANDTVIRPSKNCSECSALRDALEELVEQFDAYRNGWMGAWRDRVGLAHDMEVAREALTGNKSSGIETGALLCRYCPARFMTAWEHEVHEKEHAQKASE